MKNKGKVLQQYDSYYWMTRLQTINSYSYMLYTGDKNIAT